VVGGSAHGEWGEDAGKGWEREGRIGAANRGGDAGKGWKREGRIGAANRGGDAGKG
jgi:hypothetical protein